MSELLIGSHVSFQKNEQLLGSVKEALRYNANCFMIYTGAPQNTSRQPVDKNLTLAAYELMKANNIKLANIVVHAPYIINLANGSDFAISFLKQEIQRCQLLGLDKIIIHPGSYVKLSKEEGINNIVNALNKIIKKEQKVFICLEVMAGKGTEIGASLQELKQIIDGVNYSEKLKICLDTCHLHDGGYNITNFDDILKEADELFGLSSLACIHINDSKNESGSHKDRHENLGFGDLGFENLLKIIYHPKLKEIPKILETPYITETENSKIRLYPPYKFEIAMIRAKKFNPNMKEEARTYY